MVVVAVGPTSGVDIDDIVDELVSMYDARFRWSEFVGKALIAEFIKCTDDEVIKSGAMKFKFGLFDDGGGAWM